MKRIVLFLLIPIAAFLQFKTAEAHCSGAFTYTISGDTVRFTADTINAHGAKFSWHFGDSTMSKDRNPTHVFSKAGIYEVCLEVSDSPCHEHKCITITVGHPTYCINGNVYAGKNNAYPGYAVLYKYNPSDNTWHMVDSFHLTSSNNGHYEFNTLSPGRYMVMAGLDSSCSYYKHFAPTYYGHSLKWGHSSVIEVSTSCRDHRDIYLHENSSHTGKGHIKGYCHNGHKKVGDNSGIEVMLLNANDSIVDWTATDALGNFEFSNLANGQYKVYVEFAGLTTFPAGVTISNANSNITGVNIEVQQTSVVTTGLQNASPVASVSNILLYPNPVTNEFRLELKSVVSGPVNISVTDINGRTVKTYSAHLFIGENQFAVNVANLSPGIYFVSIDGQNGLMLREKFIKE